MARARLVAASVALMIVALPHALEDFQYGELQRFGVAMPLGVVLLVAMYALQLSGLLLTARARLAGVVLLTAAGAVWSIGAVLIHGHDLLHAGADYRHGLPSKLLEVLVIVLGATCVWQGVRSLASFTTRRG